jgi:flavorubredoxin
MMPFRNMGKKALDKIKNLEIKVIAPSHGPIYKNPERILEAYRKWTAGETKQKAIVVYVSMWSSTEAMIKTMVETLLSEGIEVSLYNLPHADIGEIAKDLVDSRAIVLGMPTVLGGMHPIAMNAANLVKALRPPLKYAIILSSYGWAGGALRQALEILGPTKIEVVGTLEINGPPSVDDCQKIVEMGKQLSNKIKSER